MRIISLAATTRDEAEALTWLCIRASKELILERAGNIGWRFLVVEDDDLALSAEHLEAAPERLLDALINGLILTRARPVTALLVGCEGGVEQHEAEMRLLLADAVAQQAHGERCV